MSRVQYKVETQGSGSAFSWMIYRQDGPGRFDVTFIEKGEGLPSRDKARRAGLKRARQLMDENPK